jgi:hypothetical protein
MASAVTATGFTAAACASGPGATTAATFGASPGVGQPSSAPSPSAVASVAAASPSEVPTAAVDVASVVGTVVRFTSASTSVDVTIGEDNAAARDFLSMLPLSVKVEEFNGREKIAYLPRELSYESSAGSDPQDGDLIYYVPWGNLGFYYNASGIGFSDQTIHLGTYRATPEQLEQFEGADVTVEAVP